MDINGGCARPRDVLVRHPRKLEGGVAGQLHRHMGVYGGVGARGGILKKDI